MKIEVIPTERAVEAADGDFLSADIDSLMNDDITPPAPRTDHDAMFSAYDRELMRFKPVAKRQTWPEPIRKR